MATPRDLRLLFVLPMVAALTCGGKSDDGRGAYVASYCDAYRPCCSAAGLSVNTAQCRMVAGSVPPSATFDKSAADDCLNGINQMTNQGQSCGADFQEPASCSQVFVIPAGTKPVGSACVSDLDCAPVPGAMVHCITWFANGSNQSECQAETRGQAGSTPCFGDVENGVPTLGGNYSVDIPSQVSLCYIDDGLYCDGTTCVALKQVGDACAASSECARTAFCDMTVGQCAALKAPGDACSSSLECQAGNYCNATTSTCAAQLVVGAACDDPEACASGNCVSGACMALPVGNLSFICAP
jgi:hypothetical protein